MRLPNQDGGGVVPAEAYDSVLKQVFVSNPDVNGVEVYSTVNGSWIGEIHVPGPAGLSFSPDFSKLVIGTITPYVYFADPTALHLTEQIEVPSSLLTANQLGTTLMPVIPYAMVDGSVLLGMGATPESASIASTSADSLVLYRPATGSFTSENPTPSGLTANPSRSGDGNYLLVNSNVSLFVYSVSTQGYVATSSPLQNQVAYLAANSDASQFASVQFSIFRPRRALIPRLIFGAQNYRVRPNSQSPARLAVRSSAGMGNTSTSLHRTIP
jgi:hypothetical protein